MLDLTFHNAGSTLRCTGGRFVAGSAGAVAVRQHVVGLWAKKPNTTENVAPGTVVRQVFLDSGRDYLGGNAGPHPIACWSRWRPRTFRKEPQLGSTAPAEKLPRAERMKSPGNK